MSGACRAKFNPWRYGWIITWHLTQHNGNIVHAAGVGTVAFVPRQGGVDKPAVGFTKVLHVPDLQCNLLLVLYLVRNSGIVVHAEGNSMSFAQNSSVLFTATINDTCAAHLDGMTARND